MKNRYGVDVDYFKKELLALAQSLEDRPPDELSRYFTVLASIAKPKPFRIDYDDDQMNILSKVESALSDFGINVEFKDDGLEHDGYCMFNIVKKD